MSQDAIKLPVDVACILHLLPHRYPFLLVDRVVELEAHKRIRALKNVTFNEPFFQGHFPGRPVMPGVLIIEAMAQAAHDGHAGGFDGVFCGFHHWLCSHARAGDLCNGVEQHALGGFGQTAVVKGH